MKRKHGNMSRWQCKYYEGPYCLFFKCNCKGMQCGEFVLSESQQSPHFNDIKSLQSPPLQESTISKKETVQESEQMYPEEFVMWKDINTDFASDSNEYLYEYGENGESKWFTLPELLTYWKDNVQGKLMVDKFKMK